MPAICNILIIDHYPLFGTGISQIVKMQQYFNVIAEVREIEEISSYELKIQPDLIVFDVMHNVSGALKTLKKLRCWFKHVPVIVILCTNLVDMLPEYIRFGVKGIVFGDSYSENLVKAIHAICSGGHYYPEECKNLINESYKKTSSTVKASVKVEELTEREAKILHYICQGFTYKQIGQMLFISPRTVETHKRNIARKLKLRSRTELVKYSIRHEE